LISSLEPAKLIAGGVETVPYRVILADSHAPLRQGLRRILAEQADLEIFGEAGKGLDLLSLLSSSAAGPLMVILGPSMPDLPKREPVRTIKATHPETKVLVLSVHEDAEYLTQALSIGAEGYVMVDNIDKELLRAIATIREGKVYVPLSRFPLGPP
jgi:two-component system, NarL family, response regulator NreC